MKFFVLLVMSVWFVSISAQNSTTNYTSTFNTISTSNANSFGAFTFVSNRAKDVEGSVHKFGTWDNVAVIFTTEGKKFTIENINLNLQRNTFESRISEDSIFTFNFNGIDKFVVNDKVYRNYYYNDDNRVYEMIYQSEELSLMKGFDIQILAGSPNPMLNRKNDKYIRRQSYYIKRNDKIRPFKLNNKTLMKLFDDDVEKVNRVENYIEADKITEKQEAIDLGSNINSEFETNNKTTGEALSSGLSGMSSHGASFYFRNPKRMVDGSFYLYENWKNNATIYISNNQSFTLTNINLNLKRNTFETKVASDSLFTFNFNNIDRFVVNDKVYKNYYFNEDNRVCEVIFESDDFSILKGFKVELIEGSANPMVNRLRDKYVRKHYYFLKSKNTVKPFKLKKSRIMKLVDERIIDQLLEYANRNNLSFKNENNVREILEFYSEIR